MNTSSMECRKGVPKRGGRRHIKDHEGGREGGGGGKDEREGGIDRRGVGC